MSTNCCSSYFYRNFSWKKPPTILSLYTKYMYINLSTNCGFSYFYRNFSLKYLKKNNISIPSYVLLDSLIHFFYSVQLIWNTGFNKVFLNEDHCVDWQVIPKKIEREKIMGSMINDIIIFYCWFNLTSLWTFKMQTTNFSDMIE